jgi:hypothetical protein
VFHHEPVLDHPLAADMGLDGLVHIPISLSVPFPAVLLPPVWRDGIVTLLVELVQLVCSSCTGSWSFERRIRSSRNSSARCRNQLSLIIFSGGCRIGAIPP